MTQEMPTQRNRAGTGAESPFRMSSEHPEGCPFDPPAELARMREERPITRLAFADGHVGWLVTSHSLAREVAADTRFSSRSELMHAPMPGAASTEQIPPAPPGMFIGFDPPEHTRYRRLLTGKFTVRRMRQLTARVEQVVADHLDAMERQGPPVDLMPAYAQPVPALMICELLGVPYADHDFFQRRATLMNDHTATAEEQHTGLGELQAYLGDLVQAKRVEPTDDLFGELAATDDLTDEELTNIATLLLGAGLDTTANMIALGTFALLHHPDQLAALRAQPELADQTVEELLRYLSIPHTGVRTALEDVELDGHLVRKGESVAVSIHAANRDPEKFPDPDRLDVRRSTSGHLAFGHGVHQCLGQQLARVEMRVALPALFDRFQTLRLDVPPERVPLRAHADIYGVHQLPVAW